MTDQDVFYFDKKTHQKVHTRTTEVLVSCSLSGLFTSYYDKCETHVYCSYRGGLLEQLLLLLLP